jgi:hypothetical protein
MDNSRKDNINLRKLVKTQMMSTNWSPYNNKFFQSNYSNSSHNSTGFHRFSVINESE